MSGACRRVGCLGSTTPLVKAEVLGLPPHCLSPTFHPHCRIVTLHIPATSERVDMRLAEDDAGLLLLQEWPLARTVYSLRAMLDIGWQIVETTPDERRLLTAHGFEIAT